MIPAGEHIALEGVRKQALDAGRNRLLVVAILFSVVFLTVAARLVDLTALRGGAEPRVASGSGGSAAVAAGRAEILDRNGVLVATSLPTPSLYADAKDLGAAGENVREVARSLVGIFPDMTEADLIARLSSERSFIYLRRNLTPRQQHAVNALGVPGLHFERGDRRVYPHGPLLSHVLGLTDPDGKGIAGIEAHLDDMLRAGTEPLRLSLDVRVQQIVREELAGSIAAFRAIGGAAMVMDVDTGELLAMVSLPDFDPNDPSGFVGDPAFNRATKGTYEMGSTFKLFNTAIALDSGRVRIDQRYDATKPIKVARFSISDYRGRNSWLSVPEILIHSSNIGSALMALDVGTEGQRKYMDRFGMLSRPSLEVPEVGAPQVPSPWRDINTMTISYGHGISVTPLQLTAGVAALVNGGVLPSPTLLRRDDASEHPVGERVIDEATSVRMRELMRRVVRDGTGRSADAKGYVVGGKTGTANKQVAGGYARDARLSSFVAAFPMDAPRYVILVMVDEPHGNADTMGYATGGWVAAPVVRRVVERMGPLLGIMPRALEPGTANPAAPGLMSVRAAM